MVSGFVTSPDDQSRICLDDASPMRIASKSLMSIKVPSALFRGFCRCLFCDLDLGQVGQRLVGGESQLPVLVDPLLAFLGFLGVGRPSRRTARGRGGVDAE